MPRFQKVYLEITNTCNLRCPFCPPTKRPSGFLTREQFLRVLDQLAPYTRYLYFHIKGEPLLHSLLPDFLTLAGERGFLCQYDRSEGKDTVWSMVYALTEGSILRAEGNPGRIPFQRDDRFSF